MGTQIVKDVLVKKIENQPDCLIITTIPSLTQTNDDCIYLNKNNTNYEEINKILQHSYLSKEFIKLTIQKTYFYKKSEIIDASPETYGTYEGTIKHITDCTIDNKLYIELYFKKQPIDKVFIIRRQKKPIKINKGESHKIQYKKYYRGDHYYIVLSIDNISV